MGEQDRGEILLGFIYDDIDNRLNPDREECWYCGGEGETYDCIDGCCDDPESGCVDCARRCLECRLYAGRRAKAIREEVIKSADTDIAIAWLKSIGRWNDSITRDEVQRQIELANLPSPDPATSRGGRLG